MLRDHFDRIVILNLARRSDRRSDTEKEFLRIGEPLDGVHTRFVEAIEPSDRGPFRSRGVHGCFLSHLRELKSALADGVERLLIVEDDVEFVHEFSAPAEAWLARMSMEPWGFLYFGYAIATGKDASPEKLVGEYAVGTTVCYAVRQPFFAPLVEFLELCQSREDGDPRGGPMEIDGAYNHFRMSHADCATYLAVPKLVLQRSVSSDVHPGWRDRWLPLRYILNRTRSLRRWALSRRQ